MNKNTTTYKVRIVNLTPAMAKELLAHNTHNRNVAQTRVSLWAESMKRGEWVFNGESIKVSENGTILDGQHRLLAVVQSGVTIPIMLLTGLPEESQDTMDTGKQRNLGDVLSLHGERSAIQLASIITGLIRWEKYGPSKAFYAGRDYPVTNGEALRYLNEHPQVRDIPHIIGTTAKRIHIPGKVLGILYRQFANIDKESTDLFMLQLNEGTHLSKGDPALTLRTALDTIHSQPHTTVNTRYLAAITIKAWNKFILGEQVRTLRFSPGGATKEKFPAIAIPADKIIEMETEVSR